MYVVEGAWECVEVVRQARVIEDDIDEVVTDVTLLVGICHVVVGIRWHHCRDMVDQLHAPVAPHVCELSISIPASIQASSVELGIFKTSQCAQSSNK